MRVGLPSRLCYFKASSVEQSPAHRSSTAYKPSLIEKFQACVVMETLCEENLVSASTGESGAPKEECGDDDDGEREPFSMFPRNNGIGWEEVGREVMMNGNGFAYSLSAGYIESTTNNPSRHSPCLLGSLTSGCDVVGVAFSRAKRSMLVTAHARGGDANRREGYSEGGQDKMKGGRQRQRPALEGCGVVCVWNAEDANVSEKQGGRDGPRVGGWGGRARFESYTCLL